MQTRGGDGGFERQLGLGRGGVYPASAADSLLHPARRLLHPPGRLARRLAPPADGRVLEIGPGAGWFTAELAARVPAGELHLLDVQPQMLERAAARAVSPVVRSTVGDACALPFDHESFDAAVATAVLGETPDAARAVAEVARILRVGGRFAVLETRTDPDFVPYRTLVGLGHAAGLRPVRRYGHLLGYAAVLER